MKKICLFLTLALGFIGAAFSQGIDWNDYTPVWKQNAYLEPGENQVTVIKDGFADGDSLAIGYGHFEDPIAGVKIWGNGAETSTTNFGSGQLKGYALPTDFYFANTVRTHFIVSGSLAVYMGASEDVPYGMLRNAGDTYWFTNLGTSALASFYFFDENAGRDAQIRATTSTKVQFWTSGDSCLVVEWKDIKISNKSESASVVASLQMQLFTGGDIAYVISSDNTSALSSGDVCATVYLRDNNINSGYGFYVKSGAGKSKWSSDLTLPTSLNIADRVYISSTDYSFDLSNSFENNLALRLTTADVELPSCSAPTGVTFDANLLDPTFYPTEDDFYRAVGKYTHYATSTTYYQGFRLSGDYDSILFVVVPAANAADFEFTPTDATSYAPGSEVGTYGKVGTYSVEYYGQFVFVQTSGLDPESEYVIFAYPFNNDATTCVDGPAYAGKTEVSRFVTCPEAPVVTAVEETETGAKITFNEFAGNVLVVYAEHSLSQSAFGTPDTSISYKVGDDFGWYAKVAYVGQVSSNVAEFTFDKKANTVYSFQVWSYIEKDGDLYYSSESAPAKFYSPAVSIPFDLQPQPTEDWDYVYEYRMPLTGWGECSGFEVRNASQVGSLFNGQDTKVFYGNVNADTAVLTTPWFSVDATEFEAVVNFGIFNNQGAVAQLGEGDSVKVYYAYKPEPSSDTVWTLVETVTSLEGLSSSAFNEAIVEMFCHFTEMEASKELALRIEFVGNKVEDGAKAEGGVFTAVVSNIRVQEITKCFAPSGIMTVDGSVTDADALVKWNAAKDFEGNNAVGYSVLYQANGAAEWDTVKDVADTSVLISGLKGSTTYTVKVSAVCADENGTSEERSQNFTTMNSIPDSMVIPELDWQKFDYKQYNFENGKFVQQSNRWQLVYTDRYTGKNDMYAYVKVGDSTSILSMHPVYKREGLVKVDVKVTVDNGGTTLNGDIRSLFARDFRFKVVASAKGDFSDTIEIGSITRNDLALHSFKTFSFYADRLKDSVGAYTFGLLYYQPVPESQENNPGASFFIESARLNYLDCETIADDTVTNITHNAANLSWSSELEYFTVVYGTETEKDTVEVKSKKTLSLSKLLPETKYTYAIVGYFDENFAYACEDSKVEGEFTTQPVPVCGIPTELTSVVDTVDAKASLSWKSGENNVSYELIWKAASASSFDTVDVKDSVYTLEDLEYNTAYVWSVRGICEEGRVSDFAEEVEFTTIEKPVSVENVISAAIRVVAQEGMIHVLNAGMLNIDRVDVYTTTGSMVTSQRVGASANVSIPVAGGRVLMVAVYSAGERAVYKVFVR